MRERRETGKQVDRETSRQGNTGNEGNEGNEGNPQTSPERQLPGKVDVSTCLLAYLPTCLLVYLSTSLLQIFLPNLQIAELGQLFAEKEGDGAGGAVAVFGHDDVGDVLAVGFLDVHLLTIDEHDDVGVLLD